MATLGFCGLTISTLHHESEGFMHGTLVQRNTLLKDSEVQCTVKGEKFQIGLNNRNEPKKEIEMHEVHSIIDEDIRSFKIVTSKKSYVFRAGSKEDRDAWISALRSCHKSSKENLGNNIKMKSFDIEESIQNEKQFLSRSCSLMDAEFTKSEDVCERPTVSKSFSAGFGNFKIIRQNGVTDSGAELATYTLRRDA